jgi:Flp pilus assembly pilin Flp
MRTFIHDFIQDESGQAIVEYILLISAVVAIAGGLKMSLKKVTKNLWVLLVKRVAGGCATCSSDALIQ